MIEILLWIFIIFEIPGKDNEKHRSRQDEIYQELKSVQETLDKFRGMNIDRTEFECLRAIILFKTPSGDLTRSLHESKIITALQDQAQLTLNKYISVAYPSQPLRFGKLLLLLPLLKSLSATTIQELFFKKSIGSAPIERLICNMFSKSEFWFYTI
jgi:nuclear receptor subfamily 2 group E protein 1